MLELLDIHSKVVWQCNHKYRSKGSPCSGPMVEEEVIKAMFVKAVNKLITNKDEIIRTFEEVRDEVFSTAEEETHLAKLRQERAEIVRMIEQLTAENASRAMDQENYKARFEGLSQRYVKGKDELAALDEAILDRQYRKTKTGLFIKELKKMEGLVTEFSDGLWHSLVDYATVHGKKDVRFMFKSGVEI